MKGFTEVAPGHYVESGSIVDYDLSGTVIYLRGGDSHSAIETSTVVITWRGW